MTKENLKSKITLKKRTVSIDLMMCLLIVIATLPGLIFKFLKLIRTVFWGARSRPRLSKLLLIILKGERGPC